MGYAVLADTMINVKESKKRDKYLDLARELQKKPWNINVMVIPIFTTERREIRNSPYPSMFELTGRQRLTVKRGIGM